MAAPRPFNIVDGTTLAPLAGALGGMAVYAWDAFTLAPRAAPALSESPTPGEYAVDVSDADETAGTVVLVVTGHEPAFYAFAVYKPDKTNQFHVMLFVDPATGALWPGAAPTLDVWTGSVSPGVVKVDDGLFVVRPTLLDVSENALGVVNAPAGAAPEQYYVSVTPLGSSLPPPGPPTPEPVPLPSTYVFSHESYTRMVQLLYPPGELFRCEPGTVLHRLNEAIADELTRVNQRAADLIEESDPRTATETLPEWERMLSLPDDVVTVLPGTDEGRRVAVTQKYVSQGGQNYAYFEQVCAACGYPLISIERGADDVLQFDYEVDAEFVDEVSAFHITVTVAPAGPGALTHTQFEAAFRKRLHAGITANFIYT